MGLALLDVADAIRPHPEVVAYLQTVDDDDFLDELADLDGGPEAREAIEAYLSRCGMRGAGENDLTRPRWSEQPSVLVPLHLCHVKSSPMSAAGRRLEPGRIERAAGQAKGG